MKKILLSGLVFLSTISFANMTILPESKNYVVSILDFTSWQRCSELVCLIAESKENFYGKCHKFESIGVVAVALTPKALDTLEKVSSCRLAIEEEGQVEGQPKLGTSN